MPVYRFTYALPITLGLAWMTLVCPASPENADGGTALEAQGFTIAVAGNTEGNLEVCGCPISPAGGLPRRASVLRRYREAGRAVLAVEAGGFWSGAEPIDMERAEMYLRCLEAMEWGPVLPGRMEFEHGRPALESLLARSALPFVVTNAESANGTAVPWRNEWTGEVGGLRVAVLGITAATSPEIKPGDRFLIQDPIDALRESVPRLRPRVDVLIVLSDGGPDLGSELCRSVPGIDLLVNTGLDLIYRKTGRTLEVFASREGKSLRLVSVRLEAGKGLAFTVREKVLGADVAEDQISRALIDNWYSEVAARPGYTWEGTFAGEEGDPEAVFVGAETCEPCHTRDHVRWKGHPHQQAMITIHRRQRYFLPTCFGCHVTGYGRKGGYEGGRPDHLMRGVQCEACHGPGSRHASDPDRVPKLPIPTRQTCERCHNAENSPRFVEEFETYWERGIHSN